MSNPAERFDEQAALEEIELYGELLIAAEAADGPLSPEEVDRVLGVNRSVRGGAAAESR